MESSVSCLVVLLTSCCCSKECGHASPLPRLTSPGCRQQKHTTNGWESERDGVCANLDEPCTILNRAIFAVKTQHARTGTRWQGNERFGTTPYEALQAQNPRLGRS